MNKIELIKLVFKYPFTILKKGIYLQNEHQYRDRVKSKYGISELPTIDLRTFFREEELSTYSFLEGTSLITDIMLLKSLAKHLPDCNYLEIGSWRGESIANVAKVAKHCTSITLGRDAIHGVFSKGIKNMTEILWDSHTFDFNKLDQRFSLIFIDGDHSYDGVLNDTLKTFPLLQTHGIVVWHDYGFSTENVRYSVLKAILDGIPADKHCNLYHVSNTMCAIYIEGNFQCYTTRFPMFPNKKFSVKVKINETI